MRRKRKRSRFGRKTQAQAIRSNTAKLQQIKSATEKKTVSVFDSSVHVNTTGIVIPLNLCQQGKDEAERDGNKITTKRLFIRGRFVNTHGTPEDCIIRMIIFRRKDVSGVLPTSTTLLTTQDDLGMMNKDHMHDYVIYHDVTFVMDTTQHSIVPFKWMKRLNLNVRFNAPQAVTASLEANGLFMWFYSTVAGETNDPLVSYQLRHEFIDR